MLAGGELLLPGEITLAAGEFLHHPMDLRLLRGRAGRDVRPVPRSSCAPGPHTRRTPRPVILNTWESVYFDMTWTG